jgi:hypothetical protein
MRENHSITPTRAQTELPALGIALLVLTSTLVVGVVLAESALTSAQRPAIEEQTARSLSERLVEPTSPQTARRNVLRYEQLQQLDEQTLRETFDIPDDADVAITLDDETLVRTGPVRGTTVERLVLVERRTQETIQPDFDNSRSVTLPRRTSNVRLTVDPPSGTTIERVYANNRVILDNETGLQGTFDVNLSSYATTTLRFGGFGQLDGESVRIEYAPPETDKAILEVHVDE